MKKQPFQAKLSLGKETLVKLLNNQSSLINGGGRTAVCNVGGTDLTCACPPRSIYCPSAQCIVKI